MLPLICLLVGALAAAPATDPAPTPEPMALVGATLREPALVLPPALSKALLERRYIAASKLRDQIPRQDAAAAAFLEAWVLVKADKAAEAASLLEAVADAPVPEGYRALVRGEVLRAVGDADGAIAALTLVSDDSVLAPQAQLARARLLVDGGRRDEAIEVLGSLIDRSDPAASVPDALLLLASLYGDTSAKAYPLLRRVWYGYPRSAWSIEATKRMASHKRGPSWQEVGRRAERLMALREYDAVIMETGRRLSEIGSDKTEDACRLLFARGRSYYKKNQLSNAIKGFGDAGERCAGIGSAYGAKALYLQGTAASRKHSYGASSRYYKQLAARYPEHSMADDGLSRAGIALQEADDLAGAQALWREALERYPKGDTVPEATWRLAWTLYLQGDTPAAIAVADRLGRLDRAVDHVHVEAGRYWAARWRLYGDVNAPSVLSSDMEAKAKALADLEALCRDLPHSFYAILAWSRLKELAPDRASAVAAVRPKAPELERPWVVRLSFLEDPHLRNGIELARLGLIVEARAEWRAADREGLTGQELAWWTELRGQAGDWLYAHDKMRQWMKTHPAGTLGEREAEVLRVAYPDRYWPEVQKAAAGDHYDLRLFHALVREESNFNKDIVSFAGARGLSQLMPATAAQVAGWLHITLKRSSLFDPTINLRIGSHYYDKLYGQFNGSPFLATAAYNAGGGRQKQWLAKWGDIPTDEYVERIPFRETRGYTKRVMGTWQTMRWQFDSQAFWDLSAFNHHAQPKPVGGDLGKGL